MTGTASGRNGAEASGGVVKAPRNAAGPKKTPEPPEETDELSAVSFQPSAIS